MSRQQKIKTSIYLPIDLHWQFKEEVVNRRYASDTVALEAAVRQWIAGDSTEVPISTFAGRWHRMLAEILRSDDPEPIRAIQENLKVLARVVAEGTKIHLQGSSDDRKGHG